VFPVLKHQREHQRENQREYGSISSFFISVRRALRKEFLNFCRKFSKAVLVFG